MCTSNRLSAAAPALVSLLLAWPSLSALAAEPVKKGGASQVDAIDGSSLKRVTLTQKAMERLDIKTGQVAVDAAGIMTAPYAALLYDAKGQTWVYTNPQPLAYVRHAVVVESIKGERAFLKEGPPAGTVVVVIGVAELYGTESGLGK
jgi:hypothetical protein